MDGKMIVNPTVLILGAGASAPFGYPTGINLVSELVSQLRTSGTPMLNLMASQGYPVEASQAFAQELAFSPLGSIDSFLEKRSEFVDIGKLAITISLAMKENTEALFSTGDWYAHLFKKMLGSNMED